MSDWLTLANETYHLAINYNWWLHHIGIRHDDAQLAEQGAAEWDAIS